MNRHSKAFTLLELLCILAICALLAAIAVPNFYEAKTSSMISRAKEDMRTIAVGLEVYKAELTTYPLMNSANSALMPIEYAGQSGYAPTLERLTTPVSYLNGSAPFWDPFEGDSVYFGVSLTGVRTASNDRELRTFNQYFYTVRGYREHVQWGDDTKIPTWFLLESTGPDKRYHYLAATMNSVPPGGTASTIAFFGNLVYDPTNGSSSKGSLWRVGGVPDGYGDVFAEVIQEAESSRVSDWESIQ